MQKIWISVGASREEKDWKNQELTWDQLIDKLKQPKVTKETISEYLAMPKDKQDAVKDVGGFVGGPITGGRRRKGSCQARYMLTLDVDVGAVESWWEELQLMYSGEVVAYTTHKHTREKPRYRLLIPLMREVLPDEHEAIARKVAEEIGGIDLYDPTTFQTERLMYWPSVSKEAEYRLERQEGEWLNPDAWLAKYENWRDISQWAFSSSVEKRVREGIAKQQDPREKEGIVGAFCRTYGIEEVIDKYLTDIYEQSGENRWTFKAGSTSAGMHSYDDIFSLSHHATDPTQGRLCNAFDLVRIHLFGDSDDRASEKTPSHKKPSFGKMSEIVAKDSEVKKTLVEERRNKAFEEDWEVEGGDENWQAKLEVDKKGNIQNTIKNVVTILMNDVALAGAIAYDDLQKATMAKRNLPWRKVSKYTRYLTDADDAEIRQFLEMVYGITDRRKIDDGLNVVAHKNLFHPIKEYLEGERCRWDGVERVDRWLIEWLGAEDNVYVRQVGRKTLVAAVARLYEPGIKFDTVPVLVGPQGLGKSTLVAKLAGEWFSDTFGNLSFNKEAMENIQGVWIMEIGELAGLKKQEVEAVKLFVSRQVDRFRVAYGRRVESFARQCIFIGTTDEHDFLSDQAGNRRFWPVKCDASRSKAKEIKQQDVDQLWAEACYIYGMGEDLWLEESVEMMAKSVQEQYTQHDDWTEPIRAFLEIKLPEGWQEMGLWARREYIKNHDSDPSLPVGTEDREFVTVPEIWCELLDGNLKDIHLHQKKIRSIMNHKMRGWEKFLINRKPYGTQRGWIRVGSQLWAAQQQNK